MCPFCSVQHVACRQNCRPTSGWQSVFYFLGLTLCGTVLRAEEPATQGFENWLTIDAPGGNSHLEQYVNNGWLGDEPPYFMPRVVRRLLQAQVRGRDASAAKM